MKKNRMSKRVLSAVLTFTLIVTACFQYGFGTKAADDTNTQVNALSTFMNEGVGFLEFKIEPSGWAEAPGTCAPTDLWWRECNFVNQVIIFRGDEDTTGTTLASVLEGQAYYNLFGRGSLGIGIASECYQEMTKIYIPAGSVFPSSSATGYTTPFDNALGDVASDSTKGYYITTEDIYYIGTPCMTNGSGTDWEARKKTTVESVRLEIEGDTVKRAVFNIAGDEDNDALLSWGYIGSDLHGAYNTKDYVEVYLQGVTNPVTLANYYKTTDGNMYWNLYEAGSMTFPILDALTDVRAVEKIVIKKGCQFPAVSCTGATLGEGGTVAPTTTTPTAYVVQEDLTFVIDADATSTSAGFTFTDTSTTTETTVTGVKTGHSNKNVTFTLSATDYAGCSTSRASDKFLDYNFLDKVQIISGETIQTLRDVYPQGEERYYNLTEADTFTIALGNAYDTVTKIVIPAGTVFPSASYTGYGAWNATSIPDNMLRNKGGFETTEDIIFEKPDGTDSLEWTVVKEEVEVTQSTKINKIHVRGGGSDFRLMLFLSNNDYTAQVEADFSKVSEYSTLDNILLYDIDGNEIKLDDIDTGNAYYKSWGDADSIGFGINADTPVIAKVVIKEGCELPTYAYTNGTAAERTMYVVENETVFTLMKEATDNTGNVNDDWYRDEILPKEEVETKVNDIHVRDGGAENGTRLLLLLSNDDYGTATDGSAIENKKFEKYNTLNYITLETTLGEIYTLSEIYGGTQNYNLWESDCLSVRLTDGLNPICKVTVKAGCELPSRAFTEGTADTQLTYVVKNDTIFTINNPINNTSNTNWVREEILPVEEQVTDITNLHVRQSDDGSQQWLLVFLSNHDYGETSVQVDAVHLAKYNLLDNIVLYTTSGKELALNDYDLNAATYNLWGEKGCIAIQLQLGLDPISKVAFKKGCEFPSRTYQEGTATSQLRFVLSEDMALECNTTPTDNQFNTIWVEAAPIVKETTKVTKIHVRGNNQLLLFLSNNDYGTEDHYVEIVNTKLSKYNTLEKIKLYTKDGQSRTLKELYGDYAQYNIWEDSGCVAYQFDSSIAVVDKVEIQAGCEFPSREFTNGSGDTQLTYVVPNTIVYTLNEDKSDNNWSVDCWDRDEELPVETIATDVNNIHIRTGDYTELLLFLSNHDYGTERFDISASVLSKYNTLDNIILKTTAGEELTLANVYGNAAYFNLWEKGSVALQLQSGLGPICEVTIQAGCELPSKAYAAGTSDTQLTYVVPENITFKCNETPENNGFNISWTKEEVYPVVTKNTDIKNIHVRTGDYPELLLFLSNHDYGTTQETMNVSRLVKYNTLDNILLYTTTGSVYTLRQLYDNAAYYNIWNEAGSVAIQFDDSVGVISKVYIKAGCELPSKEYTNGENLTRKLTYVVESDTIFTVKQIPDSNTTTVHWDKANPRTIETDVNKIEFADNILSIYLDESDYGSSKTLMSGKHANYNYLTKIRVYTSDTEYITLAEALGEGEAWFNADNSLEFTVSVSPIRIVIPAYAVFPTKAYVDGTKQEMSGYEIPNEKIFELSDGTWEDVSVGVSRLYGDANGDDEISSLDLVRMKKYFKDGFGMNVFGNCDDEVSVNENDIVLLRKSMVGSYTLHPYVKKSSNLTYFMSQDGNMDYFLNDYFKRHAGYVDYVEGEMTATSYRPGEAFEGMFNTQWVMEASTWYSSQGFDIDTTEKLREWLDKVPVDKYGYVWNGNDIVEDPNTDLAFAKHAMGWPLPNANDANTDTGDLSVYWDFNDGFNASNNIELGCVWTNNISASASNGLYTGTASGKASVYFEVKDYVIVDWFGRDSIVQSEYAPWLAIDLRMTMDDLSVVDDIYIYYSTTDEAIDKSDNTKKISVKETAPIWYEMTGTNYEHMLYVPMYTMDTWYSGNGTSAKDGAKDIYRIAIEIVPKSGSTLTGTFALNYVRPSFDTRYSNNNALFISTIKEYYDATGDTQFLREYITKARKAMNFLMQMYDDTRNLNDQSYLFGHYGSTTELYDGLTNGYWDVLYTPKYDFQSNMYFYEALSDLAYLEDALAEAGITVSESAAVKTATIDGLGSSEYTYAGQLDAVKSDVLTAVRSNFWTGTRFAAGKDNSENWFDNGQVVWNLQAIESGIANEEQADAIMRWIDGESNMYQYGLAPMTNTIDNVSSNMYSSFYPHTVMSENRIGDFGNNVQNGGAVMYSSYYDLMSRLQVNGTEDAYKRLTAIRDWYLPIANAYDYQTEEAKDFYYNYFKEQGMADYYLQNGSREGCGNGIIGLDGEFPESLLTVAAVPRGFFGVDSISASCLGISPSLPEDLQHWKIENMEFNNVKYDVSIFHGVTRIDGVDGDTQGLTVQIAMDYKEGQSVYVDDEKVDTFAIVDGKAIVTVGFKDVVVEVR